MANPWLLTKRQKEVDKFLRCAANFYGHITPRAFLALFNRHNKPKLLKAELMKYQRKLNHQLERNYTLYEDGIISTRVSNHKISEILYYQEGKPFFKPDLEEFLKYEDDAYFTPTELSDSLYRFLCDKLHMQMLSANEFLQKLEWLIRTEERSQQQMNLLETFRVQFRNEAQIKEYMKLLSDFSNTSHKWANCGYTPVGIWEEQQKEKLKAFNAAQADLINPS